MAGYNFFLIYPHCEQAVFLSQTFLFGGYDIPGPYRRSPLGHDEAVIDAIWPQVDKSALTQSTVLIVLQVNGKVRARVDVSKDIDKTALETLALDHESIQKYTGNGEVKKVIVVPGRLVNIVVV